MNRKPAQMFYLKDRLQSRTVALWISACWVVLVLPSQAMTADGGTAEVTDGKKLQQKDWEQPSWGKIVASDLPGRYLFSYSALSEGGRLKVPQGFPQIVVVGDTAGPFGRVEFNKDASEIKVAVAEKMTEAKSIPVIVAETSRQYADGTIVFAAREARVEGKQAKLEVHPANYRIGFWRNTKEFVVWDYDATRWGMYRVLLTYATPWTSGAEIEIAIGDVKVQGKLKRTESFYRYTTLDFGKIYMAKSGKQTISVRCLKKTGKSIMNLKAIVLVPACEGETPKQQADGAIRLHGRDATIHGTVLRYEPAPKKQTLGFWRNPQDRAEWRCEITTPGLFDVEVLQGCGKGQGGSRMIVTTVCNGTKAQTNPFVVEETGHFQSFKPRRIGRVQLSKGECRLSVQPAAIKDRSCCDIRQIRLLPVKK